MPGMTDHDPDMCKRFVFPQQCSHRAVQLDTAAKLQAVMEGQNRGLERWAYDKCKLCGESSFFNGMESILACGGLLAPASNGSQMYAEALSMLVSWQGFSPTS